MQTVTVTLVDGSQVTEAILNPDRVRWDMTAARHKWPQFKDAAFLGITFLAWAALTRAGAYTSSWEQFRDHDAIEIDILNDDDDPKDPTPLDQQQG